MTEIEAMVASATSRYEFRRRNRDAALARRGSGTEIELLVNGRWVAIGRPPAFHEEGVWRWMDETALRSHVRRFLVADLGARRLRWAPEFAERLRRTFFWRRIVPPLNGGAGREIDPETPERARGAYGEEMSDSRGAALVELKEQAQSGYELQRERSSAVEQRANFFLGAAGLTTTLVLANAGILLGVGEGKLNSPWRELGAVALAIASVCAIAAGIRAMQAMMLTFTRTSPNTVDRVVGRSAVGGANKTTRAYVSALLVAQEREAVIGNWKIARLAAARQWFGGAVLGVVVLTGFVLVEVL